MYVVVFWVDLLVDGDMLAASKTYYFYDILDIWKIDTCLGKVYLFFETCHKSL